MRISDFDYELPEQLIAQSPVAYRDQSRLLVLQRATGRVEHRQFPDLAQYLRAGDLLVLNDSRVIPARLRAIKPQTGGAIEVLLVEEHATNEWWAMVRPGKRMRAGTKLQFLDRAGARSTIEADVLEKNREGHCRLRFRGEENILNELPRLGEVPLPPYIHRPAQAEGINDLERYQTVFAKDAGSVAAPTAGLHFTHHFFTELKDRGIEVQHVTLHVGLGTFAPIKVETLEQHVMHEERFSISEQAASAIARAKSSGRRVIAVGTTTVRVLESVATTNRGSWTASAGRTRIFIYPPYDFKVVDALLTNFHLPRSTLLMLVSAFVRPGETTGRELMLEAYAEAIRERYRFFSYGDAMLLI